MAQRELVKDLQNVGWSSQFISMNTHPTLWYNWAMNGIQVNLLEAREAGRCFWQYSYEVTSSKPLDSKAFITLRSLGFLPNGQGFGFHQVLEGGAPAPVPDEIKWNTRVEPSCRVEVERGDGGTSFVPSYVYRVAIEIDSGD